ncbi:DUF5317 family protein [Salsipaludibacter albus]|uniref:DUF5317 family protein n=1 Tax=Salsipaludibacter albus TaxID=2849650 RepID=UPI001EE45313|nr:DUF5317 family protein [Salsipaludibacter albus]MBY5163840.1 DUF5317 domain-containing protein [Salsipaludibacter albus]
MLLGALTVGIALAVALARGRGRGLHPRVPLVAWTPVLGMGLAGLALAGWTDPVGSGAVALALVSHAALVAVGIVNFRLPGAAALTAGVAANGMVVVGNGGMPVDPAAVLALGGDPAMLPVAGPHQLMTEATVLPWLGDVVGIGWLDRVVSPGDALLVAGAVLLLTHALVGEVD